MTTRSGLPRHRTLRASFTKSSARLKGALAIMGVWLLILSSLGLSTSIQQPTAVFIETHLEDQMSLQDYWHAAVSFREIGFKANLISPYTGYSSVSPENLSGFVEALIITPRDAARFVNDIDTFADYVAKGNGLIIAGQSASEQYEPWAREAVNLLAAKFGIEFENDLVCDPTSPYLNDSRYPHWPMITRFADHNVTEGVSRISYHAGCSLRIWGNATAVAWTSDEAWSDLDGDRTYDPDEERGRLVVAAVSLYGKGRVACIGDNNLWSSRFLDSFDNNKFLLNLVRWVAGRIEEPEVKATVLDLEPTARPDASGNYTATIPIDIWNQGTSPAVNLTMYKRNGAVQITGGNITIEQLLPGEHRRIEVGVTFSESGCRHVVLAYRYYTPAEEKFEALRTVRIFADYDLNHLPDIFIRDTSVIFGSSGHLLNLSRREIFKYANETRDLVSIKGLIPEVMNHTRAASKSGSRYSIQTDYIEKNLIAIGDPSSNYVSGYVSQEGELKIVSEHEPPRIPPYLLFQGAMSTEEMLTSIPTLPGNLSEWGYLSLFPEERFSERGTSRLMVGGFGRQGFETAMALLSQIFNGTAAGYEEQLSGRVALFRGTYDDQGNLVSIDFR